ncbi:MAG: hypothetical protein WEC75_01555 [Dehalococcoidia bacterium]
MGGWLRKAREHWNVLLAFALAWTAIAIHLGPGYYFLLLYVLGCVYIVRTALKR